MEKGELWLLGDLSQMGAQATFLKIRGFDIRHEDVYRIVSGEDVKKALAAIWIAKIEGWWHYEELYIKYDICTAEEFKAGLKQAVKEKTEIKEPFSADDRGNVVDFYELCEDGSYEPCGRLDREAGESGDQLGWINDQGIELENWARKNGYDIEITEAIKENT